MIRPIAASIGLLVTFGGYTSSVTAQDFDADKMLRQVELINSLPCIHVITLQDNFAKSDPGTDFDLALGWHSYAQGIADILYPGREDRLALAMRDLFNACLKEPELPVSRIAQTLAIK